MDIQVKLSCSKCGGQEFARPENPQDDSPATCTACNHVTTVGELKARGFKQGKEAMIKAIRDALR